MCRFPKSLASVGSDTCQRRKLFQGLRYTEIVLHHSVEDEWTSRTDQFVGSSKCQIIPGDVEALDRLPQGALP